MNLTCAALTRLAGVYGGSVGCVAAAQPVTAGRKGANGEVARAGWVSGLYIAARGLICLLVNKGGSL